MATDKNHERKLLKTAEISLMLDTYDDIFSDFDPRPFNSRSISDDFLVEMKHAARDKPSGQIELQLLMPGHLRNTESEKLIKKRLHEHFRHHYEDLQKDVRMLRVKGAAIAAVGFILMSSALVLKTFELDKMLSDLLLVVLEPSGWFAMWFGLDTIFYGIRKKKPNLKFYEKMAKCEIVFLPY